MLSFTCCCLYCTQKRNLLQAFYIFLLTFCSFFFLKTEFSLHFVPRVLETEFTLITYGGKIVGKLIKGAIKGADKRGPRKRGSACQIGTKLGKIDGQIVPFQIQRVEGQVHHIIHDSAVAAGADGAISRLGDENIHIEWWAKKKPAIGVVYSDVYLPDPYGTLQGIIYRFDEIKSNIKQRKILP